MRTFACALLFLACGDDPVARVEGPDGTLRLRVHVEVARDADARMTGLRGRDSLADDLGLWIAFPVEGEVCIVNDGVPFPIDAVFIDEGSLVTAVESLSAGQTEPACHVARDVLEVAEGVARAVDLGDVATLH